MNPRVTGILFLLVAALGSFVWFYEIRGEEGRKAAEEAKKRLFPEVEAEKIAWIALTTADAQPARVERKDGAWRLVAPLEVGADGFVVDAMAAALAQITSEAVYADPQPPAVYGLGDGARKIQFGAGGKDYELRVGGKTPLGGNSYAAVGGQGDVYAIQTYRTSALGKRLDELRDKRILDFATDAVEGIRVRWPGGEVVLAREGGAWQLRAPVTGPADATTVDSLLSNLSFLRATGFADAPPPDAESGLDHPELEVELTLAPASEGAEKRTASIAMGKALPGSGERLVRGAGLALFRVPGSRLDDTPRQLVAYRFKDVARFDAADARRVELVFQAAEGAPVAITATRGADESWSSTPEAMDPQRIRTLVDELARLRARDILADSMGPDERRGLALEPPNARLLVRGADESTALAEVRLGRVREGGAIVAQAAGNPSVFELDPVLAEYLPVSLAAFRERFLARAANAAPDAGDEPVAEPAAETAEPAPLDASPEKGGQGGKGGDGV